MTVNPIYIRRRQMAVCLLAGTVYSVCFGSVMGISSLGTALDALIAAAAIFVGSVIFWNIFEFGFSWMTETYQKLIMHVVYAFFAASVVILLELLTFSIFASSDIHLFARSLPARILCLLLMYISCYFFFSIRKHEEEYIADSSAAEGDSKRETLERIIVKVGNELKVIPVDDVICIKGEDDYVSVVTAEGFWLKSDRLKDLELSLPQSKFVRVHRSYIVNIGKISRIERYGQAQQLVMANGSNIRISTAGCKVLKERLGI